MRKLLAKMGIQYQEYIPKSVICLREGYTRQFFFNDLIAGATVGIIALPLAMAFAIGSGVSPERGLFTAIVAGFMISLLGGSRVQIGGPTGAFVVIVYSIVERHGYEGLAIATLMAGCILVLMGIARFGVLLRFVPFPVITGFTTGIALVIFSSQMKDFFGLCFETVPADFVEKWILYAKNMHTCAPWAAAIAFGTLGLIFGLRWLYPKLSGAIAAIFLATFLAWYFDLPVETIEKKFGGIPRTLPIPCMPAVTFEKIQSLFPDALTIALLGAIESLLSARVADGMIGGRHRSNCELVAQGLANIGSVFFGGIPATGAIARTSANIKMGAKTPIAGMLHALTLLLLMLLFAPLAAKIPLAALAAVLVFVAWNMSELDHFADILKGPLSDVLVLLITFFLTVLIDLTVAVQVGVLLAALLFLKHMSDKTTLKACQIVLEDDVKKMGENQDSDLILRKDVPAGVSIFEINGPFFFGVADLLNEEFRQLAALPKILILRMRKVTIIDATGIQALKQFHQKCQKEGILFLLSGVKEELAPILRQSSVEETLGPQHLFPCLDDALAFCREKFG